MHIVVKLKVVMQKHTFLTSQLQQIIASWKSTKLTSDVNFFANCTSLLSLTQFAALYSSSWPSLFLLLCFNSLNENSNINGSLRTYLLFYKLVVSDISIYRCHSCAVLYKIRIFQLFTIWVFKFNAFSNILSSLELDITIIALFVRWSCSSTLQT